ncbi:MAG: metal ABC transporter solute-binding protein, Zn/Mn family [Pyrobaculum sp.]
MRRLVPVLLAALWASAATIVATFPAYDVVLREAFPNATVVLLAKGAGDPHDYQLTPEDLTFLKNLGPNDVIIDTMHAAFELKIAELAKAGEIKAKIIDVTKFQKYLTYDNEEVNIRDHEVHEHHEDHEHERVNMHEHGVYPPNVRLLVEKVAEATGLKPSGKFLARLETLERGKKFSGKAVAITPMAQYLLYWLGYRDIVVLIKEPGVPPTPEDLNKAIEYIKAGAPAVAAVARGERLRIVDQFIEKARAAGVEPKVVSVVFDRQYLDTLENLTRELAAAETHTPAQVPTPAAAATEAGVWQLALAVAIVVVAIVATLLFLKRRK